MRFYLKQHVFTFGDRFSIYDEEERECFFVEGEVFTFGKKLHIYSATERELAFIEQRLFTFLPRYSISRDDNEIAEVVKDITFFGSSYRVNGLGWTVIGDFLDHEYKIHSEDKLIASVSKQWFTWGDAYEIYVDDHVDPVIALAVVLVIDACLDAQRN